MHNKISYKVNSIVQDPPGPAAQYQTHKSRLQEILILAFPNIIIRALNNLKDMIYTMMLAARTTTLIDYVTPYTRANIVSLFTRSVAGLLEPFDALINEIVGEINDLNKVTNPDQNEIGRRQHIIQALMTNVYVVVLIAGVIAQGLYYLVGPGLRGLDYLLAELNGEDSDPELLEQRLNQIAAYGK